MKNEWKVYRARTPKICDGCGSSIRRGQDYATRAYYGKQCVPCVARLDELENDRSDLKARSAPEYRNPIDEMLQRSRAHTREIVEAGK